MKLLGTGLRKLGKNIPLDAGPVPVWNHPQTVRFATPCDAFGHFRLPGRALWRPR